MRWRVARFSRADGLKHGVTPLALDRQQGRDRRELRLRRWRGDRRFAVDRRSLAHEQVVDRPLQHVAAAAIRETARNGWQRIERVVGPGMAEAELLPSHLLGLI